MLFSLYLFVSVFFNHVVLVTHIDDGIRHRLPEAEAVRFCVQFYMENEGTHPALGLSLKKNILPHLVHPVPHATYVSVILCIFQGWGEGFPRV